MKTGLQSCNKKLSFQNTKVLVYVLIKDITGLWNHFNVQTPQIKSIEASRAKFSRLLSFVPTTGLQPRNPPIYNIFSTFFHKYTFPFFSLRGELDLQCPDSLPRPRDQHESRVFGDHSVMIRQHPDTGAVSTVSGARPVMICAAQWEATFELPSSVLTNHRRPQGPSSIIFI